MPHGTWLTSRATGRAVFPLAHAHLLLLNHMSMLRAAGASAPTAHLCCRVAVECFRKVRLPPARSALVRLPAADTARCVVQAVRLLLSLAVRALRPPRAPGLHTLISAVSLAPTDQAPSVALLQALVTMTGASLISEPFDALGAVHPDRFTPAVEDIPAVCPAPYVKLDEEFATELVAPALELRTCKKTQHKAIHAAAPLSPGDVVCPFSYRALLPSPNCTYFVPPPPFRTPCSPPRPSLPSVSHFAVKPRRCRLDAHNAPPLTS